MNISFGSYYSGNSIIHRLDPRTKLFISILIMVLIFFFQQPIVIALFALCLYGAARLSQIPMRIIIRSIRPIVVATVFAFVINILMIDGKPLIKIWFLTITEEGLQIGIKMIVRLVFLVISSSIFMTLTTTPIQIAESLEYIFKPLNYFGISSHDLGMMMSIALRFVPTLAEEADKIMKAQSSRGADFDTGKLMSRMKGMITVLVPLFVSAFKRADELAFAMEARCYRGGEGRTRLKSLKMVKSDYYAMILSTVILFALLMFELLLRSRA